MEELYQYRRDLLDRLASVVDDLGKITTAIPSNAWHEPVEPDGLTPHQVLARLRAIEAQATYPRLMHILNEPSSQLLPRFDAKSWMEANYDPTEPPGAILQAYARLRDEELTHLRDASAVSWNRKCCESGDGEHTLQWWVEQCLVQAEQHLRQLAVAKPE